MRLYYWIALSPDHECYSVIGKTKKETISKMHLMGHAKYEAPVRKVIEYKDAFDLFDWVTGEGGGRDSGISV